MKKMEELMNPRVVTVEPDDLLSTIKEIFENTQFHHLLVVEKDRLIGVISDRDLLKAISPNIGTAAELPRDTATLNKRVHQIMSREPISIEPQASLSDAVEQFKQHSISCLPVTDVLGTVKGIITWRDLLSEFATN